MSNMTYSGRSKWNVLIFKLESATKSLFDPFIRILFPRSRSMKEVESQLDELKKLHQLGMAEKIMHYHWKYGSNDSLDPTTGKTLKVQLPDL